MTQKQLLYFNEDILPLGKKSILINKAFEEVDNILINLILHCFQELVHQLVLRKLILRNFKTEKKLNLVEIESV